MRLAIVVGAIAAALYVAYVAQMRIAF